jgi:hypothetical protein
MEAVLARVLFSVIANDPVLAGGSVAGAEMNNKIDAVKMMNRHKTMLEYQDVIYPFTPTFRELERIWGLHTTSAVAHTLANLRDAGLVITRQRGQKVECFAVKGQKT